VALSNLQAVMESLLLFCSVDANRIKFLLSIVLAISGTVRIRVQAYKIIAKNKFKKSMATVTTLVIDCPIQPGWSDFT